VVVVVFGGIFDFVVFCSGIVHSSAAFCGIIFVLQHVLCAVALHFVPLRFLCHGDFCVPRQLIVLRQYALCCGNVTSAMALCFLPRPSTICCGIVPRAGFCAVVMP